MSVHCAVTTQIRVSRNLLWELCNQIIRGDEITVILSLCQSHSVKHSVHLMSNLSGLYSYHLGWIFVQLTGEFHHSRIRIELTASYFRIISAYSSLVLSSLLNSLD